MIYYTNKAIILRSFCFYIETLNGRKLLNQSVIDKLSIFYISPQLINPDNEIREDDFSKCRRK